ncbi:ATP-binding protein [Limnospira fusiformis]|uniref:ATP-binding protein n=1 Tax=Limnospira fusiformis TaxID=54297 RepID=UPI002AA1AC09|nr:ATP-binding protein [Limnospira fusiformis LS22]
MTPEQFLEVASVLPEPLILATVSGDILAANRPVAKLLNCRSKDLRGKNLLEIVENPHDSVLEYLKTCARNRQFSFGSLNFILPNDEHLSCRAEGAVIQPASHESPALILLRLQNSAAANLDFAVLNQKIDQLSQEIHHRKQAEAALSLKNQELEEAFRQLKNTQLQLIQTEKMSSLGQLVAGIAHEINNPVTFIDGNLVHAEEYIETLLQLVQMYETAYPDSSPEIEEFKAEIDLDFVVEDLENLLDSMRKGTQRILKIVKSLRNFSRLDESGCKAVDIHEGIESTLVILRDRLETSLQSGKIEVIRDYGNLPLIECYPGQLNQVFMNLISNAIDALVESDQKPPPDRNSPHSSQIRISTQLIDHKSIRISIKDNGSGICDQVCPHIFNPFFTTKPVGKGTGLGLSISYQIITQLHQGQLICRSTPHQGTELGVEIPIHQTPVKSSRSDPERLVEVDILDMAQKT